MNVQLRHFSKDQLRMTEAANPASIKIMPSGVFYFQNKFFKLSTLRIGSPILFSHDHVNNKWYVSNNPILGIEFKPYNKNHGSGLRATLCSTELRKEILTSNHIADSHTDVFYMSCAAVPSLHNKGIYYHEIKLINV